MILLPCALLGSATPVLAALAVMLSSSGCQQIDDGFKSIYVSQDAVVKVDRELDEFFDELDSASLAHPAPVAPNATSPPPDPDNPIPWKQEKSEVKP